MVTAECGRSGPSAVSLADLFDAPRGDLNRLELGPIESGSPDVVAGAHNLNATKRPTRRVEEFSRKSRRTLPAAGSEGHAFVHTARFCCRVRDWPPNARASAAEVPPTLIEECGDRSEVTWTVGQCSLPPGSSSPREAASSN
jgi:hypothetical protein